MSSTTVNYLINKAMEFTWATDPAGNVLTDSPPLPGRMNLCGTLTTQGETVFWHNFWAKESDTPWSWTNPETSTKATRSTILAIKLVINLKYRAWLDIASDYTTGTAGPGWRFYKLQYLCTCFTGVLIVAEVTKQTNFILNSLTNVHILVNMVLCRYCFLLQILKN